MSLWIHCHRTPDTMLRRWRRSAAGTPLHHLLGPSWLGIDGPSVEAASAFQAAGIEHGRNQRRWQPIANLLIETAGLVAARAASESRQEGTSLRGEVNGLEQRRSDLESAIAANGSPPSPEGDQRSRTYSDAMHRRDQRKRGTALRELADVELKIATRKARLEVLDEDLAQQVAVAYRGARALWAEYRVAFVENIPGPVDAQRSMPDEDLNFDRIANRTLDQSPESNGHVDAITPVEDRSTIQEKNHGNT